MNIKIKRFLIGMSFIVALFIFLLWPAILSTVIIAMPEIFYVKDIFGHKIISKEKIASIKKGLLDVIEVKPEESTATAAPSAFPEP